MLQNQTEKRAHLLCKGTHVNKAFKHEEVRSARAYVLIESIEGKTHEVLMALRGKPGIKFMDYLEGPPDTIVILQACNRQKLAELTNHVLALIEPLIEKFEVLPTKNGNGMQAYS